MDGRVALFLIVLFLSFFGCVFGIYYLKTRQNLSMIEKGMNPRLHKKPLTIWYLKWGLLLLGAGAGLFVAYILDFFVLPQKFDQWNNSHGENAPVYFALIAIGGGLGLIYSYKIEKKEEREEESRKKSDIE